MDNTMEDEANEREIRRIRQATRARYYTDHHGAHEFVTHCVCGIRSRTGLCEHTEHHDTPAAPERGEQWGEAIAASTEALGLIQSNDVAAVARLIQQHSTLIAQRERLLRLLRPVTSPTACYCAVMGSEKCWHCEARELITTIEQDQIASRTTTGREG